MSTSLPQCSKWRQTKPTEKNYKFLETIFGLFRPNIIVHQMETFWRQINTFDMAHAFSLIARYLLVNWYSVWQLIIILFSKVLLPGTKKFIFRFFWKFNPVLFFTFGRFLENNFRRILPISISVFNNLLFKVQLSLQSN